MSEWYWEVIEGRCKADGADGGAVYGVQVRKDGEVRWTYVDVDTDRQRVETLAARLQHAQAEPCHWEELVEDWIYRCATPISCGEW